MLPINSTARAEGGNVLSTMQQPTQMQEAKERMGSYLAYVRNEHQRFAYPDGDRFRSESAALDHLGRAVSHERIAPHLAPNFASQIVGVSNSEEIGARILQQAPDISTLPGKTAATGLAQVLGDFEHPQFGTNPQMVAMGLAMYTSAVLANASESAQGPTLQ